jgi:mannose-6-phosphate isomerase-like protein (cupin superfamily)
MSNILGALLVLAQAGSTSIPAVDVTAAEIRTTLETTAEIAPGIIDTPIRTLDTGAYDVSVAIVSRGPASNVVAGTTHTEVTEVYTVLEGSGTIVTGGRLIDPQPRGNANAPRRPGTSGPSLRGNGMEGAVSRSVSEGDIIIIPAGTPHYFSEVPELIVYTIVRIDPHRN